jgi:hypothetical protein
MTSTKSPRPGPTAGKPAAPKATGKAKSEVPEARGFELQLSCPHCGAPFVATDATVNHTCEHCRSLLIVEAPEREEVFVEPAQVTEPAAILERLLAYRIDAHRATLVARFSDEEGNPPSEMMISPMLKRFENQLRQTAKIIDCRLVHVPYRQTSGKVIQAVLGRQGDGPKIARLRGYVAEQTTPAYDPAKFNLRDAGLRLGRSVFRPLLSTDVPKLGRFVPRSEASASRRELEKWRTQNLDAGFESVAKHGVVAVTFEATVYRPYFLVRAVLDRGDETMLFDGGFGTIAGYLSDEERSQFTAGKDTDPLGTKGASFRHVSVAPSRCPNCGMDPKFALADDAIMSVCVNCHAGITLSSQGLVLMNYDREEGITPKKGTALLPFWRFPFDITIAGTPPVRTLEAFASAMFPQGAPKDFAPRGGVAYVPAWRLLTTQAGDEAFTRLAQAMHSTAWNWTPDRIGLDARPDFVPVSLPEAEARDLAGSALFALHTKASGARLNTLLVKKMHFDARMNFGKGSVALLAFASADKLYTRPEVSVPKLLLEGGPVLAAQRVTVQAAASAASAQGRPSMESRMRAARSSSEG